MNRFIPKFVNEFNPKIEQRMLIFSNFQRIKDESIFNDVMVLTEKEEPCSKDQIELVKTKHIYEMLKSEGLCADSVDEFIEKFKVCMDENKIKSFYKYVDSLELNDFHSACQLLMYIIRKKVMNEYCYKFAILTFNSILYRNSILPIIFYLYPSISLFELIDSGLTVESLEEMLMNMFQRSIEYNTKHKLISKDEIISLLQSNYDEIINLFNVKKLYIAGSYANGMANEYSDLDVVVDMDNYDLLVELENYISKIVEIPVDCIKYNDPFLHYKDMVKYKIQVI